jgi:hypothetical protein
MTTEFVCQSNPPYLSAFQMGEKLTIKKVGQYCWTEEPHVAAKRTKYKLEFWVSYTMYPYDTWVSVKVILCIYQYFSEDKLWL